MWCGYLGDDVGASAHPPLCIAMSFEAHIAGTAQLAQQRIDAIPAKVAAPLQVIHQHLPVVGPRQQVREQAARATTEQFGELGLGEQPTLPRN